MKKILLMALILFLTTGCTPIVDKYRVSVDAITNNSATIAPSSYVIKPLGEDTDANSLRFQQQSHHLAKILNEQGYRPSSHESLAEQIIYFDYGIEKIKEETRTYSEPDISFGISWGFPYGYYHRLYHPFWYDMGYSSYRTYHKTYRVFNRYIVILSKEQTGKELWRVDVSSVGESDNLKKIIPILLRGAKPYIGKNTKEPVNLVLEEHEKKDKKKKE